MANRFLDKFFKDTLSQLHAGDPENTWELLNDKLDANLIPTTTEDLAFDQGIKDSIDNILVPEPPAWDAFLPSLELDENLVDIGADINIDNSIKENLQDLQAEYDASTWETLSNKLDAQDALVEQSIDAEIDQLAYDKLLNYTVPQRAGEWESFNRELDKEFVLPYKLLFKYKLAEVAILASLLLIFFQAKPILENHIQSKKEASIQTQPIAKLDISDSKNFSKNTTSQNSSIELPVSTSKDTPKTKSNAQASNVQKTIASASNLDSKVSHTAIENNSIIRKISNDLGSKSTNKSKEVILEVSSGVTPVVKGDDAQSIKQEMDPVLITSKDEIIKGIGPVLDVVKLPLESLVNFSIDEDNNLPFCLSCYRLNSIVRWRLGANLNAEYTYIMTSYDKILDLKSYNHATLGYGAGFSTSLVVGNWELESGFNYANRQYTPKNAETFGSLLQGYLKIKIDKIQMNILSVPLNLRYHVKKDLTQSHFYVHGGATMHVTTQANYFIKSEFVGNGRRPNLNEANRLIDSSKSADKIYSSGWFEGGSYIQNRYYTVNLGLGFEQRISARYSIFGQTTYSQFLDSKGLGPNNDRFNTLSISTGVRALFK